jgi:hypothetical protein
MIMSNMTLLDLPDEIIEHILTFVGERDVGRARQVNRKLRMITSQPFLITRFPHIYVDGSLYLKEQVYFTPTIRNLLLKTTETNDLQWLVSRLTPIMREVLKGHKLVWLLITIVAQAVCSDTVWQHIIPVDRYNVLPYPGRSAIDRLYGNQRNMWGEASEHIRNSLHPILYFAPSCWSSACVQARVILIDDWNISDVLAAMDIRHKWHEEISDSLSEPTLMGSKYHQVCECMMLLRIDKTLLLKFKSMIDECIGPLGQLLMDGDFNLSVLSFTDNPWIIQYAQLVG